MITRDAAGTFGFVVFASWQKLTRRRSMMPRATASSCLTILVAVCLMSAHGLPYAHAAEATFSPQAWRQAVDPKSNWSRKELLSQFYRQYKLEGMKRKKVLELLGNPGAAYELYPGSNERDRMDIYRLSAKNDESFRIHYDAEDKVTGSPFIATTPCEGWLFIGPAPEAGMVLTMAVLRKSLLERHTIKQIRGMEIKQAEALLGKPDRSCTLKFPGGGQMWVATEYVWRLSADGRRVFSVRGRERARNWETDGPIISSYAIDSMWPDCPLRSREY